MLVKSNVINKQGAELYVNSLTGDHGTLASHFGKALKSERASRRASIYKRPQVGLVNNNRKRTNARKIKVHLLTKSISFKIEETELMIKGKLHTMKEHYRDVLRPSSKKMVSVPQ